MQNEIPAGTKVGVLMTSKGVTAVQVAEVLAHMDGLVHVDLNGEAVSVNPSQIVSPDATAPPPPVQEGAPAPSQADDAQVASVIDQAKKELASLISDELKALLQPVVDRVAALEAGLEKTVEDLRPIPFPLVDRVAALEAWVAAHPVLGVTVATENSAAPAATETPNEQGTTAAESGEPAAGS